MIAPYKSRTEDTFKRVNKNDTSAVAADKKNVMTAIVGRYK